MNIDQEFVEYVVKSLVNNPDAVQVERRIDEKGVLLELTVDPEDLGRVIGKRGATAQSLRTLLRALGTKNEARYNLKIVDNGVAPSSDDDAPAAVPHSDSVANDAAAPSEVSARHDLSDLEDDTEIAPRTHQAPSASSTGSTMTTRTRQELEELDDLDV